MGLLVEAIRLLEQRIAKLERELTQLAKHSPACVSLLSVPGVGLLTKTAMVAATGGTVAHFKDACHFASWFGLTPREFSSGSSWVLAVQGRTNHNKAACALANKLARICFAVLRDAALYGQPRPHDLDRKSGRTAFAIAA